MASVAVTAERLQFESGRAPVTVRAAHWVEAGGPEPLERPVDESASGRTVRLRFPPGRVSVERPDGSDGRELASTDVVSLSDGEHLVTVRTPGVTLARFEGPATLATTDGAATLSFPRPTHVTVGFRSVVDDPPGALVVPETPSGMATALTYAAASHRTTTADRSFPAMRRYPPPVAFGDERIPDAVADARPATDLDFRLPADPAFIFPAAPLAYYLGAEVTVGDVRTPRLRTPERTHEFGRLRSFESEAASLLRRVFHFDCLVRGAGPHGAPLAEASALDRLGVDADRLYDATPAERLDVAVETPFEEATDLPPWHLTMYVDPTVERFESLPHLLRDVPAIRRPSSQPLANRDRLSRSLDDFFRSSSAPDMPPVDLVQADVGPGATHGWLAEGVPVDVFKSDGAAYEHRFAGRGRGSAPLSVDVVCNDSAMEEAFRNVVDVYRSPASDRVDLRVHSGLTAAELARVFEAETDFVHFIGHCDEEGLRCADGALATGSLDACGARAFFLNACRSYYQGQELVRLGSVAGAVTLEPVLDTPARRVSRVFTRLLLAGFDVQRALQLARRRIVMSTDYILVGDGTHTLTGSEARLPGETRVEARGPNTYSVEHVVRSPRTPGDQYCSPLDGAARMVGDGRETTMRRCELLDFLDDRSFPVIYDGDIREPDEVRECIARE